MMGQRLMRLSLEPSKVCDDRIQKYKKFGAKLRTFYQILGLQAPLNGNISLFSSLVLRIIFDDRSSPSPTIGIEAEEYHFGGPQSSPGGVDIDDEPQILMTSRVQTHSTVDDKLDEATGNLIEVQPHAAAIVWRSSSLNITLSVATLGYSQGNKGLSLTTVPGLQRRLNVRTPLMSCASPSSAFSSSCAQRCLSITWSRNREDDCWCSRPGFGQGGTPVLQLRCKRPLCSCLPRGNQRSPCVSLPNSDNLCGDVQLE